MLGSHGRGGLRGELIEFAGGDALVDTDRDFLRDDNLRVLVRGETWAHVSGCATESVGAGRGLAGIGVAGTRAGRRGGVFNAGGTSRAPSGP